MNTYEVSVYRHTYHQLEVSVEAKNEEHAQELAEEMWLEADEDEWEENGQEYECLGVEEV